MGVKFETEKYLGTIPKFWRGEAKILPGGYKLTQTLPKGTIVPKGTALEIIKGTLTASIAKRIEVIAGGTAQKPRVMKNSFIQANDIVMKSGTQLSVTVSSIDSSNTEYDVLNLSAAITGLTAGDILIEAASVSTDSATPKYMPNAVVGENTNPLNGDDSDTVSAAYDGVLLWGFVPSLPEEWLQGICLKNNPNIILIKQ